MHSEDVDEIIEEEADIQEPREADLPEKEKSKIVEFIDAQRDTLRRYARKQVPKLIGTAVMLFLMMLVILYSDRISGGDRSQVNVDNIINYSSSDYIILILTSSIIYLSVLVVFTRVIFVDRKEDFAIKKWRSTKSYTFFALTIMFISMIYILLDVSLVNIYLQVGPALVIWFFHPLLPEFIPAEVDRFAYSQIRAEIFTIFFVATLLFVVVMFLAILSKSGRQVLTDFKNADIKPYGRNRFLKLIGVSILIPLVGLIAVAAGSADIPAIVVVAGVALAYMGVWWIMQVVNLILRFIRFIAVVSFSNIMIILPIILVFYVLPGLLWGIWDLFTIYWNGTLANTIYDTSIAGNPALPFDSSELYNFSNWEIVQFYFTTVGYNLLSALRVIQLDFVIIIGISASVIGFAEGYSLFALIKSIRSGVVIAKSGRIVRTTTPKIVVMSTRVLLLMTWLSILWEKFLNVWGQVKLQLGINIPDINIPTIFVPIYNLSKYLENVGPFFLSVTILMIPLYFIISSAFKFLSVSIAVERVEDNKVFYLLISSAFILIVTKIYSDIAALPDFIADQKPFLPLGELINAQILEFIIKINDFLESLGFFLGLFYSMRAIFRSLIERRKQKKEEPTIST